MGLDMYLEKKVYVGRIWNDRESQKVKVKNFADKEVEVDLKDVKEFVLDAGYWRKANAIHKWFVDNVQEGEDDCKEYFVSREQLEELLKVVKLVLAGSELVNGKVTNGYRFENGEKKPIMEDGKYIKDPTLAQKYLPTESGFFFGGTEYDQWYYADLENTKEILEKALKDNMGKFYYSSSW